MNSQSRFVVVKNPPTFDTFAKRNQTKWKEDF